MKRRSFLRATLGATGWLAAAPAFGRGAKPGVPRFELDEVTVAELQAAMSSGRTDSFSLTRKYRKRIEEIDRNGPRLRAVIELNPDAPAIARQLDRERKQGKVRGPLHGIPVLLKDNIDTHDRMMTTAGSLALLGSIAPRDSFVAAKLREAGAVILGKTNLSEWANFRASRASSGWSGRGGQTKNPYALDRNPSGSSSGSAVAVAANLCVLAVGTETDGSIISPSAVCGIIGLKPTVGLVSRAGIIPISSSQDTAGPMARTVTDAAILLSALTGVDERDGATAQSRDHSQRDYTRFLSEDGLRGARIGIARKFFRAGNAGDLIAENAIETMKKAGAIVIDPADLPSHGKIGDAEFEIMLYEFKAGLNAYLASLPPEVRVRTLRDVIDFNERNKDKEMPFFGQEVFLKAEAKGSLTEQAYRDALEKCRRLSRDEGIDAVMDELSLDAIMAPSGGPAGVTDLLYGDRGVGGSSSPAAVAGYPSITVPAGNVSGMPVGISFFGRAWSEPTLLKLAFSFEQHSHARIAPRFPPSLG